MNERNSFPEIIKKKRNEKSSMRVQKAAFFNTSFSASDRIMFLQRTIGNKAVERMIMSGALQAKLNIGNQPSDSERAFFEKRFDVQQRGEQTPNIQKYPKNIHYDLTKTWAESYFGAGSPDAERIAAEDWAVDEGWSHPHISTTAGFFNVTNNDILHFPSRNKARNEITKAMWNVDIYGFGKALHRIQDSYSHSFPTPPGTGYNLDSKAHYNTDFERNIANILRKSGGNILFPNTLDGRGAAIRHVVLGYYPDDFKKNPEQASRDQEMESESKDYIRLFYDAWKQNQIVPIPPSPPGGIIPGWGGGGLL